MFSLRRRFSLKYTLSFDTRSVRDNLWCCDPISLPSALQCVCVVLFAQGPVCPIWCPLFTVVLSGWCALCAPSVLYGLCAWSCALCGSCLVCSVFCVLCARAHCLAGTFQREMACPMPVLPSPISNVESSFSFFNYYDLSECLFHFSRCI